MRLTAEILEQLRSEGLAHDGDERRIVVLPVEYRAEGDADGGTPILDGYGATFNQWEQIGPTAWGFMERIAPGAFAQTIKEDDIRSFFNHDSNYVLGRNTTATLKLSEDDKGLRTVIRPPDTQAARDVVTLVKRGDVSGMSFMFRVRKDQWDDPDGEDGMPKRTLLDIKLVEVGPVSLPAYPQTSIAARDRAKSFLDARQTAGEAEQRAALATLAAADGDRQRRLRLARASR